MSTSGAVGLGEHVCGFYWGLKGRDPILLPFLRAGLRAGENCLCVVHATEPSAVVDNLGDEADAEGWVANRQLEVWRASDTYLRGGRFSRASMLGFCAAFIGRTTRPAARMVGECGWVAQSPPGSEELLEYETEINRRLPEFPQRVLCLYDLEVVQGQMLVDVLKTHPKVMLRSIVLDNPNYVPPATTVSL
ncbi:MAG: protein kinase family protein [Acidimicrobiia bacterium]|nr:protein kinase family protein [Acidimicrobiia bacterium]